MEEDGKILPGSNSAQPADAGSLPSEKTALQTPPPASDPSDAPTLLQASALPAGFAGADAGPAASSQSGSASNPVFHSGMVIGGRYHILRMLGQGGMGAVYQARDQELDRVIALKVIRPELAANPGVLQRFKQELIVARHVTHKNVVRIYDLGEADGVRFITMEYVEGEDLGSLLWTHRKFAPAEAVQIVQKIAQALDAAHAEGVIHRDLKPHNVMRDRQGRIVVMDFGLARSQESPGMTQTGALLGTLEYMSPEQALGGSVDQRSDLFALGLIFYELLTGNSPYKAETAIASLMKRTQAPAPSASDVDAAVPRTLSAIVAKCLERDPKQRFQSAHELLQVLDAWQANPLTSVATGSSARPWRQSVPLNLPMPARRTAIWIAVVAALAIALLALPATRNLIFHHTAQGVPGVSGIPSLAQGKYLAVLPLKVVGDEKGLRFLADGVVDALSAKMFQLQEIHLASSSAVDKAAGKEQSLSKLAHSLGVNLVLQGTVQGNADRFLVTLDLENVSAGRRLWSKDFPGVSQDLLTVEDRIYSELVDALELKPTADEMARSGVHPTENIAAYDLYLKGRDALRGSQGARDTNGAIKFFEDALQKDPNFALAYTGMADADLRLYKDSKDPLYAEKALAAAQQASRLSPNLPEVDLALGSVYSATGRNAEAIEEIKSALKLAPNSDAAYSRLADAYLASGRTSEAIAAYDAAVHNNPYFWYNHNKLGGLYFVTGDTQKALEEFQRAAELAPDNIIPFENVGAVYMHQGKWEQSLPTLEKALQIQPDATTCSNLGTAYFFLKRYDEAVKMFEKAVALSPKDELLAGNLADAYRWSGHQREAVATYDKAIQLAYQQLQVNPRSASVTGELAIFYAKKGDTQQGMQYIRQARALDPSDVQLMYYEAQVYALAGKNSEALHALQRAIEKGYSPLEAENDPELQNLKQRPEFARLVSGKLKKPE